MISNPIRWPDDCARRRYVNSRGEKSRRKIESGSDRQTHEFPRVAQRSPRGNVVISRANLSLVESRRERQMAQSRPIGGAVWHELARHGRRLVEGSRFARTIRFVRPLRAAAPLSPCLLAIPGFVPNRLRHEGEKEKEAGARSLPITGSLLIIVIGLPRNRQPIRTRSQRSEPGIIGAQ